MIHVRKNLIKRNTQMARDRHINSYAFIARTTTAVPTEALYSVIYKLNYNEDMSLLSVKKALLSVKKAVGSR